MHSSKETSDDVSDPLITYDRKSAPNSVGGTCENRYISFRHSIALSASLATRDATFSARAHVRLEAMHISGDREELLCSAHVK
jgi:hypothetical protein